LFQKNNINKKIGAGQAVFEIFSCPGCRISSNEGPMALEKKIAL
jgi:hypothetical protein